MRTRSLRKKVGENYYENILSASSDISRFDPAVKQIELDLLRTLPNNRHYETLDSYGIPQLRRVLLAYSRHNPIVGYCQGLNRLAAIALLYMDEEDAFWLLVAIIECIMPVDYYSKTLIASQVDQRVLKDLLTEKLPRLNSHFEQNNVDLSLYTFTWFLTIFVDNIPPETYMRIWDVFLYEGSKVHRTGAILHQIQRFCVKKRHGSIAEAASESKPRLSQESDVRPRPPSQIRSYKTLCGYLSKYSSKGLIRTAKRRWFVFCENNCKLYYYRSSSAADNRMPLGEIDVSKATFLFEANNKERPGIFTISTPGKDFILEAKDRQASLFWLQELQRWRQLYSRNRTLQVKKSPHTEKGLQGITNSGLLGQIKPEQSDVTEDCTDNFLLEPIEKPQGVIGEESIEAHSAHRPLAMAQQRMIQLRSQMMNSVAQIKMANRLSGCDINPVTYDCKESVVLRVQRRPDSPTSPTSKDATNLSKSKSPSLNTLKKKVQQSFRVKRASSEAEKYGHDHRRRSRSIEPSCTHCRELQVRIVSLKDDLTAAEDELSASKEVSQILHKQLEVTGVERDTLMKVCQLNIPKAHLDLLREKENKILTLRYEIVDLKNKQDDQNEKIEKLESTLETNSEEVALYKELMQEKDKVVISLTNEIFDLETEKKQQDVPTSPKEFPSRSNSFKSYLDSPTSPNQPENFETLKDSLEAYELQNKFLNKEILELNQLRRDGEDRERSLTLSCSEWEARCYQIQSKLLFLLKELEKPSFEGNRSTQEVVSRLLEEAMEENNVAQPLYTPSWGRDKDYDELGFNWKWGKEEDLLSTKATNLKQKSEGITSRIKDPEITLWNNKWENYIVNLGNRELPVCLDLKNMMRTGVPRQYRGRIWKG